MKIGIISDIHGNMEALNKALQILEENNVDEIFCLGDIVGYGPDPGDCINKIKENCSHVVLGNHDAAIIGKEDAHRFNRYALISNLWTADHLTTDQKAFLNELPYTYSDRESALFVHSSPFQPEYFNYILSPGDAMFEFAEFSEKLCFIGHSHKPAIFSNTSDYLVPGDTPIDLSGDHRFIVNVGSVGQPRDGDSRGCLMIYDSWKFIIEYHRFEYPYEITQDKIAGFDLPEFLAERLSRGM
ncbi:MAG: metallophosphoesterase family protein [Candidatus Zixiibacteriota bacterium]